MDFVEICNVYVGKMAIKAAKRIFNSDKICRSYSDLKFGVTFLEHSVHPELELVASPAMVHWSTCPLPPSTCNNFIFSSLWSKSDSQLSKYCAVYEMNWCKYQQLTALSISTALVPKLLVIEQLLQLALKFSVSAP